MPWLPTRHYHTLAFWLLLGVLCSILSAIPLAAAPALPREECRPNAFSLPAAAADISRWPAWIQTAAPASVG